MAADSEQASEEFENTNGNSANTEPKKNKADKRKEKKKKQKENKQLRRQQQEVRQSTSTNSNKNNEAGEDIIIEYVSAPVEFDDGQEEEAADEEEFRFGLGGLGFAKPKEDPFADIKKVFEKFASAERVTGQEGDEEEDEHEDHAAGAKDRDDIKATTSKSDDDSDDEGDGKRKVSKKQRRLLNRMKIAELKQHCERPDVVEVWDVTSPDPQLLVFLKAYRNTVAVPRHWSQKRKYLQGKRGIEKPPFKLPDFIEATGISEMRQSYKEKEDSKKLKQKQRERMAPKTGRMDIDYTVLHDAFFKYQSKPKLTAMGEMYYEGKEYEARVENVKPGVFSDELRQALGMTDTSPPPWLINMQRYGPPPSYPNLKVPGLNAPIPPGAQFGYQPGGWGKPPVDEEGNALYGDVFGQYGDNLESDDEVDRSARWGELEPGVEESEEEESEEEEEQPSDEDLEDGIQSGLASGMVSGLASGVSSSLPSGIETPDVSVNLRKGSETSEPRQLYTVLEQKQVSIGQNTLLGTDHVYVMPDQRKDKKKSGSNLLEPSEVEVTLLPEEIEGLDAAGIQALYEEKVAERKANNKREDFSDMVAAKAAQQKRKLAASKDAKAAKKQKDFKF